MLNQVGFKTVVDLSQSDKTDLGNIGLSDDRIQVAGDNAVFGAAFLPPDNYEDTETIRYDALGVAVEELRTDKGLTRSEVAKQANVSALPLQRLETNQLHTNCTIPRLDQVAAPLGVELYDLYNVRAR